MIPPLGPWPPGMWTLKATAMTSSQHATLAAPANPRSISEGLSDGLKRNFRISSTKRRIVLTALPAKVRTAPAVAYPSRAVARKIEALSDAPRGRWPRLRL